MALSPTSSHGSSSSSSGSVTKVYDYEVASVDKASIDTFVDGTTVTNFAGYVLLELWLLLRSDDAGSAQNFTVVCNNDTTAIYDTQEVGANNITANSSAALGAANWSIVGLHGTGGTASYAAVTQMTIPFPNSTTFFKAAEAVTGMNDGTLGNNWALAYQVGYRSTAALTRLKFAPLTGGSKFKIGSRVVIYGR